MATLMKPRIPERVEAIRSSMELVGENGFIFICQGPGYCENIRKKNIPNCRWCHVITPHDTRTPEQVETDILKQQFGH